MGFRSCQYNCGRCYCAYANTDLCKQLGYGPGITIYTILCGLATYGGFMLWKMFLVLDSDQYPVRIYADLIFRIYGSVARSLVSVLQSTQLLFNVGIIILINGLSLEQIITGSGRAAVCFIALCLVWALASKISFKHYVNCSIHI